MLYSLFKKTYGLKSTVKNRFAISFLVEIFLIFIYQYYEVKHKKEDWPYWNLILIPRTVYIISLILLFYGFIAACKSNMIYSHYPQSKQQRIVSLFTLLLIAILPILLIINGPYLQIVYLTALISAVGFAYCFKGTFLYNSILHYTMYSVLCYRMFYTTGHKLDFLNPKIARTFVGFPEFNLIITFSITIMDFIAIVVFLLALLPIISINLNKENTDVNLGVRPNSLQQRDQMIEIDLGTQNIAQTGKFYDPGIKTKINNAEPILYIVRNYAIVMLFIDIMQDYITRYLVFNFEQHFFDVSHIDFTFRFINWAIYFVVALNCFLIGKA